MAMEWCFGIVAAVAVVSVIAAVVHHQHQLDQLKVLLGRIEVKRRELGAKVQQWFMIQPCLRCHEFRMTLLEISPNGRSVHYQCLHCKKKMHAAAGTPDAPRTIEVWNELVRLVIEYNGKVGRFKQHKLSGPVEASVVFNALAAPLPYEQTTRTPIPEAIRSEVWRREWGAVRAVRIESESTVRPHHSGFPGRGDLGRELATSLSAM